MIRILKFQLVLIKIAVQYTHVVVVRTGVFCPSEKGSCRLGGSQGREQCWIMENMILETVSTNDSERLQGAIVIGWMWPFHAAGDREDYRSGGGFHKNTTVSTQDDTQQQQKSHDRTAWAGQRLLLLLIHSDFGRLISGVCYATVTRRAQNEESCSFPLGFNAEISIAVINAAPSISVFVVICYFWQHKLWVIRKL